MGEDDRAKNRQTILVYGINGAALEAAGAELAEAEEIPSSVRDAYAMYPMPISTPMIAKRSIVRFMWIALIKHGHNTTTPKKTQPRRKSPYHKIAPIATALVVTLILAFWLKLIYPINNSSASS